MRQPAQPKRRYGRPAPGAPIELTPQGVTSHVFGPLIRRTAELLDHYRYQDLRLMHEFLVAARTVIAEHAD